MRWCFSAVGSRFRLLVRDYEGLQSLAVILLYIQIFCALFGSLGAQFNGVLLVNLMVALFALVAIESSSQRLGRTYVVLLFFSILLDVAWFILFSHAIWKITPDVKNGPLFVFSLKLALWMQIVGFSVRFLSSFVWIQIYRLGASSDRSSHHEFDCDARNSFLSPSSRVERQHSRADEILGSSIYDPAYYSSLFEDARDSESAPERDKRDTCPEGGSASAVISCQRTFGMTCSFQNNDVESGLQKSLNS